MYAVLRKIYDRRLWLGAFVSFLAILPGQSVGQSVGTDSRPKADFSSMDIFLFDLDLAAGNKALANGKNVTAREGYDNQPRFTPDGASFVFVRGDDYQTDVYEYFLASGETRRITNSPAMEFSPTPTPDNRAMAFVSDLNGSIWLAQRDAPNAPSWLFERSNNPEAAGYFAWNYSKDQMLYWSRFGYAMVLIDTATQERRYITGDSPPSTPHQIPGTDKFSFVHRQGNEEVWIKELDPETLAIRPLIAVAGSNHNYVWAPDASILMVQGDVLYRAVPGSGAAWKPVAKLSQYGLRNANRLAVSPDGSKLAVVANAASDREN